MKDVFLYNKVRELVGVGSDHIRRDWHHYDCPSCGGVGTHRHPPLGINIATGAFKCFRCGLSGSVNTSSYEPVAQLKSNLSIEFSRRGERPIDRLVLEYMGGRGIRSGKYWAFGRGAFIGCPVFPSCDIFGEIRYLQARRISTKNYIGSGVPSLDMGQFHGETIPEVVLVEGPMDMLRVRQDTNKFCSCAYSSNPSPGFLEGVARLYRKGIIGKVSVLFDAEKKAQDLASKLAVRLEWVYGVESRRITWDRLDGQDPAGCGIAELMEVLEDVRIR